MAKKNVNEPTGFKAEIDKDTVGRMEEGAMSQARGMQRRVALLQLSMDSNSMIAFAKSDPEAFEEMAGLVLDYQEHAQALLDVANSAAARIMYVHGEVQHG